MNASAVKEMLLEAKQIKESAIAMDKAARKSCTHLLENGTPTAESKYPDSYAGRMICTVCGQDIEIRCLDCDKYNPKCGKDDPWLCKCVAFKPTWKLESIRYY